MNTNNPAVLVDYQPLPAEAWAILVEAIANQRMITSARQDDTPTEYRAYIEFEGGVTLQLPYGALWQDNPQVIEVLTLLASGAQVPAYVQYAEWQWVRGSGYPLQLMLMFVVNGRQFPVMFGRPPVTFRLTSEVIVDD